MRPYFTLATFLLSLSLTAPVQADDLYWQKLIRNDQSANTQVDILLAAAQQQDLTTPDTHLRCRFPARYAWLQTKYPEQTQNWPEQPCPALNQWLKDLDTNQITLVFASDYLNNPSSMFGHTLLRLDSRQHSDDVRLLSYAINYSAQTNTTNGLEFAWKGLTGGYPGAFSLLPYYEKVKEYNDWESRDLWEYELSFEQEEVNRLQLVYWEWREFTSPYYFFTRNCSYELLGLLEMAQPSLDLQSRFNWHAMPTDTLRAVLDQPNLLKRITYRAASGTKLEAAARRNSRQVNRQALALSQQGAFTQDLTPTEQAQALEAAYDDLYTRHVNHKADAEAPTRLRQLLTQRSMLDVQDQRIEPVAPTVEPSQGHGTGRWSVGVGHDHETFATLRFRPAYHDWLDPSGGYRTGAGISFLDVALRAGPSGLKVEEATIVGIDSLAPANSLHMPTSWSVRLGVDRALTDRDDDTRHSMTVLEGGAGLAAWVFGALCYGQNHGDLRGSQSLDKGYEVGIGARFGCIGQIGQSMPETWRWSVETRPMYRLPDNGWSHELRMGLQRNLNAENALRVEGRQYWREQSQSVLSLSWLHYF
ncbi:MAG: DUF4105 domain-containing protein [Moraxellaceae bacterium]|nr:DUF4105 domain-containing protein [Moraxellaceae bacterium]